MLNQNICNMLFKEETGKFAVNKEEIYWRFGYYNENLGIAYLGKDLSGRYRITICKVGGYNEFRRSIRHELWHYKNMNTRLSNEILAFFAEFFPLEKILAYRDI